MGNLNNYGMCRNNKSPMNILSGGVTMVMAAIFHCYQGLNDSSLYYLLGFTAFGSHFGWGGGSNSQLLCGLKGLNLRNTVL